MVKKNADTKAVYSTGRSVTYDSINTVICTIITIIRLGKQ